MSTTSLTTQTQVAPQFVVKLSKVLPIIMLEKNSNYLENLRIWFIVFCMFQIVKTVRIIGKTSKLLTIKVVHIQHVSPSVAFAGDHIQRVPPHCGTVRSRSGRIETRRHDSLPIPIHSVLSAIVASPQTPTNATLLGLASSAAFILPAVIRALLQMTGNSIPTPITRTHTLYADTVS